MNLNGIPVMDVYLTSVTLSSKGNRQTLDRLERQQLGVSFVLLTIVEQDTQMFSSSG
jgi:hypothetical protein